jgi:hypothetical protein
VCGESITIGADRVEIDGLTDATAVVGANEEVRADECLAAPSSSQTPTRSSPSAVLQIRAARAIAASRSRSPSK